MNPHFPILLVEGDDREALFAKRTFRQAGLHNPLRVVRDGEQAIAYLCGEGRYCDRQRYPLSRLVIMGFNVPRKPRLEVLQWMRRHEPFREIPTVMVSDPALAADAEVQKEVQKARKLGITAHLTKALDFKEIQHIYKIVVDHWNLLMACSGNSGAEYGMKNW